MLTIYSDLKEKKIITVRPLTPLIPDSLHVRVIGDGTYSIKGNQIELTSENAGTTDFEVRGLTPDQKEPRAIAEHVTFIVAKADKDTPAPPMAPVTAPGPLGLILGDGKDLETVDLPRDKRATAQMTEEQAEIERRQAAKQTNRPKAHAKADDAHAKAAAGLHHKTH